MENSSGKVVRNVTDNIRRLDVLFNVCPKEEQLNLWVSEISRVCKDDSVLTVVVDNIILDSEKKPTIATVVKAYKQRKGTSAGVAVLAEPVGVVSNFGANAIGYIRDNLASKNFDALKNPNFSGYVLADGEVVCFDDIF
jgi:ketol-acid reductoisomerase